MAYGLLMISLLGAAVSLGIIMAVDEHKSKKKFKEMFER